MDICLYKFNYFIIVLSLLNMLVIIHPWASLVALVVKNSPANAGDTGDVGWIPESERSPGGGNGQPTPIFLPGEFPWTEELGGLWSMGSHGLDMTEHLSTDEHQVSTV